MTGFHFRGDGDLEDNGANTAEVDIDLARLEDVSRDCPIGIENIQTTNLRHVSSVAASQLLGSEALT